MSVVVVGWGWVCVGRLGVGFACVRVRGVRALGVRASVRFCVVVGVYGLMGVRLRLCSCGCGRLQ